MDETGEDSCEGELKPFDDNNHTMDTECNSDQKCISSKASSKSEETSENEIKNTDEKVKENKCVVTMDSDTTVSKDEKLSRGDDPQNLLSIKNVVNPEDAQITPEDTLKSNDKSDTKTDVKITENVTSDLKSEDNKTSDTKLDLEFTGNNKNSNTDINSDKNIENSDPEAVQNNENQETNYDPNNVEYIGDVAVYTDPQSGFKYKWDSEKNEWVNFTDAIYSFEGDTHVYTSNDGSKYFWDKERNGWFPKVEEDFMAQYQMNYGFTQQPSEPVKKEVEIKPVVVKKPAVAGVKRKASEPTWFEQDEKQSTKVYVSNLPLDITEEEFVELMQKCGIIMRDPITNTLKIKLYSDPESKTLKGDGLCTYIRVESVELALNLLDGYDLRGKKIHVERAKFQMRGAYDPKLKPKSKKRKDKDKLKKMQQKLFDWRPEKQRGERAKHERIVILKNMFDPKVFDDDVGLILEFKNDLNEECSKCGEVRKVTIFDRHPEGVAQVNMADHEAADAVVALLNGRWFGKRQLSAEIWDGRTKYRIAETDSQISQRLDNWDKFLEGEEKDKEVNLEKKSELPK